MQFIGGWPFVQAMWQREHPLRHRERQLIAECAIGQLSSFELMATMVNQISSLVQDGLSKRPPCYVTSVGNAPT